MKSLGIILATFALTSILALGGDFLLMRLFPASFDDQGVSHDARILGVMLLYTIALSCLGGYLVARFTPSAKRRHAMVFGLVLLIATAVGTYVNYYSAPPWYHYANLLTVLPAAILGGRIRARA
ncbi:MAG TPA: hypothetical protein VEX68_17805 [Bryobacteraceae bacterium]|nr:hypothetical protein [Bryobacteraceae bacterium]